MPKGYEAEATPEKTRAEDLRDQHFYNGKWHSPSGGEMGSPTREILLRNIEHYEKNAIAQRSEAAALKSALDVAQQKYHRAEAALVATKDNLDINKIMLAEQMEIPQ